MFINIYICNPPDLDILYVFACFDDMPTAGQGRAYLGRGRLSVTRYISLCMTSDKSVGKRVYTIRADPSSQSPPHHQVCLPSISQFSFVTN